MKNEFFEQKLFNNFDAPMQKLMELNVKMMQNLSLMKPVDLLSLKRPEDFFEKNMELFIQNSHMTLEYMRETFNILEGHWLNVSRNLDQNTKKMMSESSNIMQKSTQEASTAVKSAVKKGSSAMKKATSTAKKAVSGNNKAASASPAKKGTPTAKKSSVKKVSSKKNTKLATSKASPASKNQEAKSNPQKSTVLHGKEAMAKNAPKSTNAVDKNMPKIGSLPEKSNLNIQNMGKSNPMPNH
ncbi:hypothetical protein [Legionella sp. PC997]|uniref:hypothetical protein n=1 Tax=Legionella sp. PC997 TaxID=2755562 RepID=UPI0015FAB117|nr:hypothetical protein [Legionella sp. PC997]QMT60345.1 hypothetical protein HBNCFIEN_01717 [Legionella sp. PC997]